MFNGDRIGPITYDRELRQGYPLSPYLYIICDEGLFALIRQNELIGRIHGVHVCRSAPRISHLLFAYDNFLFCQATTSETDCLK